ncbi:PREDICTED: melanoma inhibitory activity protein 3-like [Branchiostoma belcheri]|uniref:Melanoma inhibitory activity protein 3-like n=1 Tax=Branchiostoma belcheri TaxID=7741 RepID=A0A6P4Z8P5_BRABE|nr:PREDICTED: melanoma inhibitory activity protein 3-like [Branchiostoma belcheri]
MDEASASEVEPDVEKLLETPELKEIQDKIMEMTESIAAKTQERTETLLSQLESKLSFATADATDINSQDAMQEDLMFETDTEVKDEQEEERLETEEEKISTESLFPFGSGENVRQQLREQVEKLTKSDDAYQKQQEKLRKEMLEWTAKMKEKREEARKAKENKGATVIDGTTIDWDEVLDDDVTMSTEDLPFDWDEVLDKEAFMSEYSQIMGEPFGEGIVPTSVQSSPDSLMSTPVVDLKAEATDGMLVGDLEKDVAKPGMQQLLQGSEVSPGMGETDSISAAELPSTQQTEPLQSAHISESILPPDQTATQTPLYILPDEPDRGYSWDGQRTENTRNFYMEGATPEQVIDKVGLGSEKLDALRAEEEKEDAALDQEDAEEKEQPTSEPATPSELESEGKEEDISQTDTEDIYIELDFQFIELLGALVPPEWAEQLRGWGLEYTPSDLIFQGVPIPWLAVVTTLLVGIVTFCVFSYKCVTRCVHGKPVDPAVVKKQLEAELDKAAKEKEDLRKGAEAAEDRIRELEETLDVEKFSAQALSKKNSELEEKLSSNDQLEVTLRQEIQRLMDQVSDAREQLESATSEYAKHQETEAEYKKNLKKERKEKEKLQERLTEIESKTKHLDSEIVTIKEHRDLLEESKHQLEEEIQGRQEQFTELKESIEMIKQENEQLKENVQYKENEIEVLRDCLMQIKALESEDAAAIEEDTEDASTAKDEKIQQMLDVARINSTLKLVESERDYLRSRLEEADGSRKEYEDKTDRLQIQVDNLTEARKRAEKQYYEAQVRLNTLQDYFKEKEVELQRKLGKEEMIRQDVSGKVQDTQEKYRLAKEQVELYQNQKDDLMKEMQESERSFRNQIAAIEKKAHESWMAARTSEREAQDSKREAATLRQKLLEVENALAKEKDKYLVQSPPLIKPTPINGPPPFPPRFSPPLLPPGAPRHGPPFGRSPPPGRNGDFDGPPSPPPEMAFRGPHPPWGLRPWAHPRSEDPQTTSPTETLTTVADRPPNETLLQTESSTADPPQNRTDTPTGTLGRIGTSVPTEVPPWTSHPLEEAPLL